MTSALEVCSDRNAPAHSQSGYGCLQPDPQPMLGSYQSAWPGLRNQQTIPLLLLQTAASPECVAITGEPMSQTKNSAQNEAERHM